MKCRRMAPLPLFLASTINDHQRLSVLYRLPLLNENFDNPTSDRCFHLIDHIERFDSSNQLTCFDLITDSNQYTPFAATPRMEDTDQMCNNCMLCFSWRSCR